MRSVMQVRLFSAVTPTLMACSTTVLSPISTSRCEGRVAAV